jgi:phosphopantothenoylcysteine decarboxylase / phosphopantothenate---cysteine ligase
MKVVVTAGPTREHLDPVRFLSNPSTGKMGFAVAAAAARRGCDVTLVAGPVALKTPKGVRRIDVVSAREMLAAVEDALAAVPANESAAFVSTAAVADWRPATCAAKKLKKHQMSGVLRLVRNPDILKTVRAKLRRAKKSNVALVGFAAETNDVLAEAARKCREKGLAFIVANDVTEKGCGFGTDTNRVTFVFPDGTQRKFPLMSKPRVAAAIIRTLELSN